MILFFLPDFDWKKIIGPCLKNFNRPPSPCLKFVYRSTRLCMWKKIAISFWWCNQKWSENDYHIWRKPAPASYPNRNSGRSYWSIRLCSKIFNQVRDRVWKSFPDQPDLARKISIGSWFYFFTQTLILFFKSNFDWNFKNGSRLKKRAGWLNFFSS